MNFVARDPSSRDRVKPGGVAIGALENLSSSAKRKWVITYRAVEPLAILADILLIILASTLSGISYHLTVMGTPGDVVQFIGVAAIVTALFIAFAQSRDLYTPAALLNFKAQARRIAAIWTIVILFLAGVAFALKVGGEFSRGTTLSFAIFGLVALIIQRLFWRMFLADGLAMNRFSGRKVALITDQTSLTQSDLAGLLTRHGLQLARHFVFPVNATDIRQREHVIAQAISGIRGSDIQEIVVGADLDRLNELNGLLADLRILPLPVNVVPLGPASELLKLPSHKIGDITVFELQHGPLTVAQRMMKRAIDVLGAATGLALFFPLLLLTALAIKLDSRGPVLFHQRRCGFNGRQFHILKFRTMSVLEDGDTILQAERNDKRVTRIGKWLRRTSIDELPQLVNVLQGNMSLVGPRPHALAHDSQYEKLVSKYALRHHAKPGLTGWAQVNGYRGQTQTVFDMEQRVKRDLWYLDNWSLGLDLKILFLTIIEVAKGRDAY